ncbi:MAG TPA: hypothetical protein VF533_23460 [Solirubrobacteraceae bacterium]|jgi:hypothetical protein
MTLDDVQAAWSGKAGERARGEVDAWHAKREQALPTLREFFGRFTDGQLDTTAFRSATDSWAKSEPWWGFQGTALMFFTQLWKSAAEDDLAPVLRAVLRSPDDDADCREKIESFRVFVSATRDRAKDLGRTQPQLGRINFFLSFFWEAQAREKWPIYYPNSRDVLVRHGLLVLSGSPADDYLAYRDAMFALAERFGTSIWVVETLLWYLGAGADELDPLPEGGAPAGEDAVTDIYSAYRARELIFPDEVVTSLALSLLTKRFLILSGISGTGKTKLAQGLAAHLEALVGGSQTVTVAPEDGEDAIHVQLTAPRIKRLLLDVRPTQEEFLDLPERGDQRTYDAVQLPNGQVGQVRVSNFNFADPTRHLVRLRFKGAAKDWLGTLQPGDLLAVDLDGNGAVIGLRRVDAEVQEVDAPSRHRIIPVKSDWTDARGLLGYHNPLTGRYVRTPLIDLLLAASEDPSRPYVAILDEMNLARVEYYLSDFLSAMESGEAIPLRSRDELTADELEDLDDVPDDILVPPNLTFVGTVNVDETTHAFSPKVLDRANVIEFNEVDVGQALGADAVATPSPFRLTTDVLPAWFIDDENRAAAARQRAIDEASFGTWLSDVHGLLARYDLHFGYRVINEVAVYVGHALELVEGDPDSIVVTAFDLQLLQKVLPKLVGGRELEEPLAELLRYAVEAEVGGPVGPDAALSLAAVALGLASGDSPAPKFPRTTRKLHRMLTVLRRTGFVAALQ